MILAKIAPDYIPSPVAIFKALAAGLFRPMDNFEREGREGAGPDAMVLIRASAAGDLFITADWQDGESLHIEIAEPDGATWALDHTGVKFEQICEAFLFEDHKGCQAGEGPTA